MVKEKQESRGERKANVKRLVDEIMDDDDDEEEDDEEEENSEEAETDTNFL